MDSIRAEWERAIRISGMKNSTVSNYKSASRAWTFSLDHSSDIDLIVTDQHLSDRSMTGLDLVQRVRRNPQTQHIPVIMLSVSIDNEFRRQAVKAGVTAYFSKPMDRLLASELFAGLMQLSRHHRATRATLKALRESVGISSDGQEGGAIRNDQPGKSVLVPLNQWVELQTMSLAIQALNKECVRLTGK